MHACKAAPPTTSSRAFSPRYHRSGNFVVDRTNVITDPTSPNCHAENGRRERVALLLANNAGSLAGCRRSLPSHPFSLFSPRHPLSRSFSFSLFCSHLRDPLRLGLRAREQPCFCRPIVSARVAASSARPLCEFINVFIHSAGIVSQLLSLAISPPTFLSIATDRLRRYVAH